MLRRGYEQDGVSTTSPFVDDAGLSAMFAEQKRNFLRDQSGMKQQLSTLQQLIGVMDPELYRHLDKAEGLNLFFCFRCVVSVRLMQSNLTTPTAGFSLHLSGSSRSTMFSVCGRSSGQTTTATTSCCSSHSLYSNRIEMSFSGTSLSSTRF